MIKGLAQRLLNKVKSSGALCRTVKRRTPVFASCRLLRLFKIGLKRSGMGGKGEIDMGRGSGRGMGGSRGMGQGRRTGSGSGMGSRGGMGAGGGMGPGMGRGQGRRVSEENHSLSRKPVGSNTLVARIDSDQCTGCGMCVSMCPMGAITMRDDRAFVDPGACTGCGICEDECPVGAVSIA